MHSNGLHQAKIGECRRPPKLGFAIASCVFAGGLVGSGVGECAPAPIHLLPQKLAQVHTAGMPSNQQALLAKMPPDFHHFGVAAAGKPAAPEALTLRFTADTTITNISSTPDFQVVADGTCQKGHRHASASTCQLVVQFTPRGAGPRLGQLTVNTVTDGVASFGLLGYYYSPVVSFTPSLVVTVAATVSGTTGLINSAHNLGIDNGDELYIADTGNNAVRYIDSSGVMTTLASSSPGPWGVAVDTFGEVYFDTPSTDAMNEIYDYGPVFQLSGSGTDSCTVTSPCNLSAEALTTPGELSIDSNNNLFFVDGHKGAAFSTVQPLPANLIYLYDPFPYQQNPPAAMAADTGDNLYSMWANGSVCEIVQQSLSSAENSVATFNKIAGGRKCGFSGDGGRAGGAEIGNMVGQIAFDLAGNMYFSDTANNRIRRVDASTGIIRTIAGNGSTGRRNGTSTSVPLGVPTGITVDSQGQVYVLTPQPSGSATQVVEQLSAMGSLSFSPEKVGTPSAPLVVNVANTGNASLTFNSYQFAGANRGDFTLDPGTTNCNFTAGNSLNAGQSCQIGVVFKPGAAGARVAVLNLVDNTVNAANKVKLTGTGT